MMQDKTIEYHKIKPSARLLETIGRDLIKDSPAAIIELVKNAYDADSKNVNIIFSTIGINEDQKLKIEIQDYGHGMDFDTVINKWMVPATKDKLDRKYSPKGRLMQGRKGIGRYASSYLGDELLMETVDLKGNKTTILINWTDFDKYQFLDEIDILVESYQSNSKSGTKLEIIGANQKLTEWNISIINELLKELRKLLSPVTTKEDDFIITIEFTKFPYIDLDGTKNILNEKIIIEPYPLIDLYDYRLSGSVSKYGKANLIYENKSSKILQQENLSFIIEMPIDHYCGKLDIDLRVFDRDPESIDNLISKGLKNPYSGEFLGKNEVRELLNQFTGISIYRGDFRIRPYGESTFDWLQLDKQRVQNPSMRIGHNQIIGFITIEDEENSHLEEKSARDGLKENMNYQSLIKIVKDILSQIELKRFDYRKKSGKGRKYVKIEKELYKLFDFENLNKNVQAKLTSSNVESQLKLEIEGIIKKEEESKSNLLEEIKMTIAIYQGQATLGKIIMVVLHEGRKPISYFRNQSPVIISWINELHTKYDKYLLQLISDRLTNIAKQTDFFVNLFDKLQPLAVKKRPKKRDFGLKKIVDDVFRIFEVEINKFRIKIENIISEKIKIFGWEEDFYILFSNLVENSIFWLKKSAPSSRKISVSAFEKDKILNIDFFDNGPGIEEKLIEDDLIFEPGFSTKQDGTGLGLAIGGEAIERNNGTLKAIYNKNGAYFRIEIKLEETINE
jgi:signal transduction histidine kinase/anti-sigma regulatory factor (Ser/Thr protein kinase)